MVNPPAMRDDTPFDDFEVEDERMADGRTIHYYIWPERAGAGPDAGSDSHPDAGATGLDEPDDV